jgi:hypothetical protein
MAFWKIKFCPKNSVFILRRKIHRTTMKKILYQISFLILGLGLSVKAQVTNTATDAFGYRFNGSTNWATGTPAPSPATYEWIEISQTGTRVTGLGDDNIVGPIPLGINFRYYWNDYDECYVGSNGYIMFGGSSLLAQGASGMPNIPLVSDNKGNFIAPYLADLTFVSHATGQTLQGAKVYYQTVNNKFVITFDSVRFWNNTPAAGVDEATGLNTFQIVLDPATKGIQINYKTAIGPWFAAAGNTPLVCGMENITGQLGLRWRRKNAQSIPLPPASSAVRVDYPSNSTYVFRDVQSKALFTFDNKGGAAFTNVPKTLKAFVRNAGTVKVTSPCTTRIIVYDNQDNAIYNQSVIIDSLQTQEEKILDFPVQLNPGDTAASFKVLLRSTLTGDQFAGNNEILSKLIVLDSTEGSVDLKFTKANPGVVDARQGPGTGMVFDAPYLPMVVSKISADMMWPDADAWAGLNIPGVQDSLTNTKIMVFLGDGPGGALGTLVDSFTISSPTPQPGLEIDTVGEELVSGVVANRVLRFKRTMPTPYSWYNENIRIYVGAIHNQTTRFVWNAPYMEVYAPGTPASGRCLEITGGVWGENRGKDSLDVGLGLIGDPLAVGVNPYVKAQRLDVEQNIPNPANEITRIGINLPSAGKGTVTVRDLAGREVLVQCFDGKKGKQDIQLNIKGLEPQIYFYTVQHATGVMTKKLIVR